MNIILTGASSGIGFETAKHIIRKGNHKIYALARNLDSLHQLKNWAQSKQNGSEVIPYSIDLSKKDAIETFIKEIKPHQIDILINNAGTLLNKPFGEYHNQEVQELFQINMISPLMMIQSLLPFLSPRAHIVNIGSMGGVLGSAKFPGLSVYSASKGALAILTECLAEELKDKRISVNCLALGAADTEMLRVAFPGYKAGVSAEAMAEYIVQFAFEGHHYYNGKVLPVSLSTP